MSVTNILKHKIPNSCQTDWLYTTQNSGAKFVHKKEDGTSLQRPIRWHLTKSGPITCKHGNHSGQSQSLNERQLLNIFGIFDVSEAGLSDEVNQSASLLRLMGQNGIYQSVYIFIYVYVHLICQ